MQSRKVFPFPRATTWLTQTLLKCASIFMGSFRRPFPTTSLDAERVVSQKIKRILARMHKTKLVVL